MKVLTLLVLVLIFSSPTWAATAEDRYEDITIDIHCAVDTYNYKKFTVTVVWDNYQNMGDNVNYQEAYLEGFCAGKWEE